MNLFKIDQLQNLSLKFHEFRKTNGPHSNADTANPRQSCALAHLGCTLEASTF